jgi:hypothetical protein
VPVESVVVVAAVLLAFGIFAGALAWADSQSRRPV